MAPGLPPFTFNLLPGHHLEAGWRLPRSSFTSGFFPLEGEDWGWGMGGGGRMSRTEEPRPQNLF